MRKYGVFSLILVFALFSLVTCAKKTEAPKAGEAKAESLLNLLPKDSMAVVVINVQKAMATEFVDKTIKEQKTYEKYQEFIQKTGIDPQKDVFFAAIGVTTDPETNKQTGAGVINLKYNKETLLARMQEEAEEEIKSEDYNGITIYQFEDKGEDPGMGAFLDDSHIAFGNSTGIRSVIDIFQKKAEGVMTNPEMADLIKKANQEALVWSAVIFPPEAIKQMTGENPMMASLEHLKSLLIYFDYKNKNIEAEIKAIGTDESKNKEIADLLNGFKAMGSMAAVEKPEIGELLNKIEISSAADHVKIYASLPEELMTKLSKDVVPGVEKGEEKEEKEDIN